MTDIYETSTDQLMKAITICNPYPELILRGDKRVENRNKHWTHRGPILLHAGLSRSYLRLTEKGTVDASGIALAQMTFGAIVGVMTIVDCVRPIRYMRSGTRMIPIFGENVQRQYPWLQGHEHAEGEYCLLLGNVQRFETPIPASGKLGVWDYAGELPELQEVCG